MGISSNGGGEEGEGEQSRGLKKGPWTAVEDAVLTEYVKKHGEGNWNSVQKNIGLARCGKSCRLRWANHLRPDLKKGSFSPEEEKIIIELHAKLGNKWARMAAQLPGRTDNEIKNYWNTRTKRRQRAGLPIYPIDIQQEPVTFHRQQQYQHHLQNHTNPISSYSPKRSNFNHSLSLFNPMNVSSSSRPPTNPPDSNQFKLPLDNNGGNGGFALPLSPVPPFEPCSLALFTQSLPPQTISTQPLPLNFQNYNSNLSFSSVIMEGSYDRLLLGLETELPSIQTPPNSITQESSGFSSCDGLMGVANNSGDYEMASESLKGINSGLLDALLIESQARNKKSKIDDSVAAAVRENRAAALAEEYKEESHLKNVAEPFAENRSDDLSSFQSLIGEKRPREDVVPLEEMYSMDDDLMSLLNFSSAMPLPDWYTSGGDAYYRASSSASANSSASDLQKIDTTASIGVASTVTSPETD